MLIGTILIVLGFTLLLQNLGLIPGGFWDMAWPLFLMAIGVSLVFRRHGGGHGPWCSCGRCRGQVNPE